MLANKQPELSLKAVIACKNGAGQRWQREDEAYLSQLALLTRQASEPNYKTLEEATLPDP